jgi:thymidylate synthase
VEIRATNVNDALVKGLQYLQKEGKTEQSRNGAVLVAPEPVVTIYSQTKQHVLFSGVRDANPFFHLLGDALWVLAGRNDLAWPAQFNSKFAQYSDDGQTVRGSAYGYRWRQWFGWDQLQAIIKELKANPASRRCVLTMWDAGCCSVNCAAGNESDYEQQGDFGAALLGSKDVPCNTHAYVDVRDGKLNLTVCNRSNDIWFGCYGANAVHFSMLQEYLAAHLGVAVGTYYQVSNNYHLYTEVVPIWKSEAVCAEPSVLYPDSMPLIQNPTCFDDELEMFFTDPLFVTPTKPSEPFLHSVAIPMYKAWQVRKTKQGTGLAEAQQIAAPDWRRACVEWIQRREAAKATEANNG